MNMFGLGPLSNFKIPNLKTQQMQRATGCISTAGAVLTWKTQTQEGDVYYRTPGPCSEQITWRAEGDSRLGRSQPGSFQSLNIIVHLLRSLRINFKLPWVVFDLSLLTHDEWLLIHDGCCKRYLKCASFSQRRKFSGHATTEILFSLNWDAGILSRCAISAEQNRQNATTFYQRIKFQRSCHFQRIPAGTACARR